MAEQLIPLPEYGFCHYSDSIMLRLCDFDPAYSDLHNLKSSLILGKFMHFFLIKAEKTNYGKLNF